jgi:Phage tail protein
MSAVTTRGAGAAPTPEGVLAGPVVIVLDPQQAGRAPLELNTAAVDADGVEWWADNPDGWDFPEVETSTLPRAGRHGVWVAPGWYRARSLTLRGVAAASTLAAAQRAVLRLAALADMSRTPGVLTVWESQPARLEVRLAGRVKFDRSRAEGRHVTFEVPLVAADPRRYAVTEQSVTFGTQTTPSTDGGFELPLAFAFDFATEGAITGGTPVDVAGTITTPPKFTFRGPCSKPRITNVTLGSVWWQYDGTLAAGERLEVDVDAATVLLNGVENRYYLTNPGSTWWHLAPGRNVLSYSAAGAGTGDVTIRWRSAWL